MPSTVSVFLNVNNIDKSLEFYERLGFKVDNRYKDEATGATKFADLSLDGAELGLGSIQANDEAEFRAWVSTPLGAGVIVTFNVPNVDAVFATAKKSGATIETPLTDRPYGRVFGVNDPDGYTVMFSTDPK